MQIEPPEVAMQAGVEGGKAAYQTVINHEILIWSTEISPDNPEAQAGIAAYGENIQVVGEYEGSQLKFSAVYPDMPTVEKLQEGTNPVLGGNNGTVTHVDGHQSKSLVEQHLWGTPADWLAIQPHLVKENVEIAAPTMVSQGAKDGLLSESDAFASAAKGYVVDQLKQTLGGASA